MSSGQFRFKKFSISQHPVVMKVGTDGVLLGAWASVENKIHILDIGSGTGVIALMLAQRTSNPKITCIDISNEAVAICKSNFEALPIDCEFEVLQSSLQDYSTSSQFDLIVCNPPFFKVTSQSPVLSRNMARQMGHLNFEELINHAVELLDPNGTYAVIIPFDEETNFHHLAIKAKLRLQRKCTVFPTPDLPAKRVLLEYGFNPNSSKKESLIIEDNGRHQYSEAYKNLTKDFYLDF